MFFSGGHFNPAVTLGATLAGALSPLLAAGYVLAQIIGAILGAAFVRVCIDSEIRCCKQIYSSPEPYA